MGIKGVRVVKRDELQRFEPAINNDIGAALHFPETGIVSPFDLTIAYAENAVQNGVVISLNTIVQSMDVEDSLIKSVETNRGTIKPKVIVNAAGVFCDDIAAMASDKFYSIHPRKGTIAVLDKKYSDDLVQTVITTIGKTSAKKRHTKDGNIVHTVYDNALIGPDSFETIHKEDFSTSPYNIRDILAAQVQSVPDVEEQQIIAYYSGVRASTYEEDFVISKGWYTSNIIHAAGMQEPGLTAAPAIAVDVTDKVLEFFGDEKTVGTNPEFNPKRLAPPRPSMMDTAALSELIDSNPDYGIIVCRCENITKGEIVNALRRNVRCDTIDGVKRRVRPGMGRCHGSYCAPHVLEIISSEKRLTPQNVRKSGSGSEKLFGSSKALLQKRAASEPSLTSRRKDYDPETMAILQKRAMQMQAADEMNRKDSFDDGNE